MPSTGPFIHDLPSLVTYLEGKGICRETLVEAPPTLSRVKAVSHILEQFVLNRLPAWSCHFGVHVFWHIRGHCATAWTVLLSSF